MSSDLKPSSNTDSLNDEFHQSEASFRAMFNHSAVGIGILSLDRKILDANPAMCQMLGMSHDELIGLSPAVATYQDDFHGSTDDFEDLLSGKKEYYWREQRYVRKNGEVFWAHVTMSVVYSSDGTPLYMVGMVVNIDEQKRAQAELAESEKRFRAMFENTSVGIVLTSLDRRILQINEAAVRITGYSRDEVMNIHPATMAIPEDRFIGQETLTEMLAGKRDSMTVERRFRRKNQDIYWGRVTYSLVRDQSGNPLYLIALVEDINDQKLAAEKMATQEADYRRNLEQRVVERTHELSETNQRLIEEMEQRQRAEQALAAKAADEAIAAERTRLARDLHDAVTQNSFLRQLDCRSAPGIMGNQPRGSS